MLCNGLLAALCIFPVGFFAVQLGLQIRGLSWDALASVLAPVLRDLQREYYFLVYDEAWAIEKGFQATTAAYRQALDTWTGHSPQC